MFSEIVEDVQESPFSIPVLVESLIDKGTIYLVYQNSEDFRGQQDAIMLTNTDSKYIGTNCHCTFDDTSLYEVTQQAVYINN